MKTTAIALVAVVAGANAFVTPSSFRGVTLSGTVGASSKVSMITEQMDKLEREVAVPGGGFWFGSAGFWGEEDYRGFVDTYKPDNLINGVYPIVDRVRSKKLLTATAEAGLLSALADAGLTLGEAEKLLPVLEESGVLSFVAKNGAVLINLFGFIAVEPAELALPAVVSLVKGLSSLGLLKLGSSSSG
ncbi:unnamed protein product [Discosporangium mesarthrocarpum]